MLKISPTLPIDVYIQYIFGLKDKLWATCRLRGAGGASPSLLRCCAHLYQVQGRFDLALAILLRLQSQEAFDFIAKHALLPLLRPSHIIALFRICEVPSSLPPPHIVLAILPRLRSIYAAHTSAWPAKNLFQCT